MRRLYIGNLAYAATKLDIEKFFDGYTLLDVRIMVDKESQRPRGFAFVELESPENARAAVGELDGQDLLGRKVLVNFAREKERGGREERRGRDR